MTRDKVTIHKWMADEMDNLPPETYKQTMNMIFKYGYEGELVIPDDSSNETCVMVGRIINQLNRNNQLYRNGCKGGRPRKESPK